MSNDIHEVHVVPFLHPQLVAVRFGRRVNELQHKMELAWLMPGNAGDRVRELWHELRLLARGLTEHETERENWAAKLSDAQGYWESHFQKEWHVEAYSAMQKDLVLVETGRVTHSGARTISEVLDEAISIVSMFLATVCRDLYMCHDQEHREAMSFGHRLDQVVHTPLPRHHLCVVSDRREQANAGWACAPTVVSGSVDHRIELSTSPLVIPQGLVDELRFRWQQLGFSGSNFPEVQVDLPRDAARQIETAMESQLGREAFQVPAMEPGFLGITIDGVEVHRREYQPIQVESRLNLAIIRRLTTSGSRRVSLEELSDDWEAMGGNEPDPEPTTIRGQLARIRPVLRRLGIQISNVRNVGWRLAEIEDTIG